MKLVLNRYSQVFGISSQFQIFAPEEYSGHAVAQISNGFLQSNCRLWLFFTIAQLSHGQSCLVFACMLSCPLWPLLVSEAFSVNCLGVHFVELHFQISYPPYRVSSTSQSRTILKRLYSYRRPVWHSCRFSYQQGMISKVILNFKSIFLQLIGEGEQKHCVDVITVYALWQLRRALYVTDYSRFFTPKNQISAFLK